MPPPSSTRATLPGRTAAPPERRSPGPRRVARSPPGGGRDAPVERARRADRWPVAPRRRGPPGVDRGRGGRGGRHVPADRDLRSRARHRGDEPLGRGGPGPRRRPGRRSTRALAVGEGMAFGRDLANRAANDLTPERMAEIARELEADGCTRRGPRAGRHGAPRHGLPARRRPGRRPPAAAHRGSSCRAGRTAATGASRSSGRASASTPAASASSPPMGWGT